jgi:8-oxo-dGTP pyrophosphatase MutT (NUDIX family)
LTTGQVRAPSLVVVAVDADGTEVARLVLGHGDDPTRLLARQGWKVCRVRDVVRHPTRQHVLTMTFVVDPALADPVFERRKKAGLNSSATAEGEVAVRHQRVAAYAVVTSTRGFLMTQFSDRTGAPGQWGLPGGGLEPGESPEMAVVREVWEESGQVIEVSDLASISTRHWVGPAPTGQLEDFHAVRVIYRAVCPEPTDPVVHDVGGTTAAAAWWPEADLDLLALTSSWRSLISEVVIAPGKADGSDEHHHDTNADDRAGPHP